jgi:hypothetical protein
MDSRPLMPRNKRLTVTARTPFRQQDGMPVIDQVGSGIGPMAFPGSDGQDGADGFDGAPGDIGPVGPPGPTGPPGSGGGGSGGIWVPTDGQDGEDGLDGFPGATGPAGPPGTGAAGLPGGLGLPGQDGEPGQDGFDGFPGAMGPAGPAGSNGAPGGSGAAGWPGLDGVDGENGFDGFPGAQGPPGPAGGGGGAVTRTVVNVAYPAKVSQSVTVVDATVAATSKINVWASGLAANVVGSNDAVDYRRLMTRALAGSFILEIDTETPWAGALSIDYTVTA